MHRLIYISAAAESMLATDIVDIMTVANARNAENDITGLLIYNGLNFLQVLEGAQDRVDRLFSNIRADQRHVSVVPVVSEAADARIFGQWSMCLKVASAARVSADARASDFSEFLSLDMPEHIRLILGNFHTLKG
ncbi:BLUF domain-containing protein [Hyphomonas johnsonii]|jgi:hypothetical protein|uniref:BLUF domain-containing protein n=1 Tax=Hyphomonas johnsonii MHS-2 TaxID=1280950 RepID=A0A059FRL0_9PROT|nr:BLUF domain-containing protein [Hyphomonas johnsonii]KCZ93315.1 BLUF domain-containing protein [Hyphomonas johnsonii MHS-2]